MEAGTGLPASKEREKGVAAHKGVPILNFETQAMWEHWLLEHGTTTPAVWLKFAKKGSGHSTVSKAEAIEGALAHGWVDGQLDKFDESFWLVRFTPRGPRSKWSQVNRATASRLLAEGRMAQGGLAEIEKAKSDGRWDAAYAPQSTAEVPDDLQEALDAEPDARAFFATLNGSNRYAIIYRINAATRASTRAERIAKFVAMLRRGETIHPQGAPK